MTEWELTNKDILAAVSDYTLVPEPPRDACCDSYHVYIQYQRVAQAAQRKLWKYLTTKCHDRSHGYVPKYHSDGVWRMDCEVCRRRIEAELGGQE